MDLGNDSVYEEDELTLGDLGGKWVKNPKVGESVTFTVKRFRRQTKNLVVTNPQTKRPMNTALSGTDKGGREPYKIEADMMDGSIYSISNWEVWGKLQRLWQHAAEKAGNPKLSPQGLTFTVKHTLDGQKNENAGKECYVVGLKQADGSYVIVSKDGQFVKEQSTV